MCKIQDLRVVDLFSGIGGLSLGMEKAGFNIVLAVDNWQPAVDIYKENFKHPIVNADLNDIDASVELLSKYEVNMIIGGPPCQDYSAAGKRDEEGGRANLTISYAKIVDKVKPYCFIMENVDMIVRSKRYKQAIEIFKNAGYGISARTLDASLCGVPQKRKRHIVVGLQNAQDGFLDMIIDKKLAKKSMTVRDYLGDSLGVDYYYRHPRNYNRRAVFSIDEPSPTIRGVNRPIPSGYKAHKIDACQALEKIRPLSTKERSFIQTFPEDFKLVGSKTNIEQTIGNAVPVNLGKFIGECIGDYLNSLDPVAEPILAIVDNDAEDAGDIRLQQQPLPI